MKAHLKILMFIVILGMSRTACSQEIVGDWYGLLDMHEMQLRLVYHIEKVNNGYSVVWDSPDQSTPEVNAFGLPIDTIFVQGNRIVFKDQNFDIYFSGIISPNNTFIEGIYKQHGDSVILSFGKYPLQAPKDSK